MNGSRDCGALIGPPRCVLVLHSPPPVVVDSQNVPDKLFLPAPQVLLRLDQVPHQRHRPLPPPLVESVAAAVAVAVYAVVAVAIDVAVAVGLAGAHRLVYHVAHLRVLYCSVIMLTFQTVLLIWCFKGIGNDVTCFLCVVHSLLDGHAAGSLLGESLLGPLLQMVSQDTSRLQS